jgi:hypothetical protein
MTAVFQNVTHVFWQMFTDVSGEYTAPLEGLFYFEDRGEQIVLALSELIEDYSTSLARTQSIFKALHRGKS